MGLFQCINALLQVDIIGRQLCLSKAELEQPYETMKRVPRDTLSSTCPSCSLVYWRVLDAKGVIWAPRDLVEPGMLESSQLTVWKSYNIIRKSLPKVLEIHLDQIQQ